MKIASWNVNSIRVRLPQLTAWLTRTAPDVACLQETKVEDERFPHEALGEVGYRAVVFGQKSYNGVAVLTRFGVTADDPKMNLDGDDDQSARRALAVTVDGIRVVNVYVPNGQSVGAPAFTYKLDWLERLKRELVTHTKPDSPVFLCGDFNVARYPIDVYAPDKWEGHVLYHPEERARLEALIEWGLVDVVREKNPNPAPALYSWWDYRMGGFRRNQGLRIDYAFLTQSLAERVTSALIDKRPRELERPSDHAPVVVELDPP